MGYKQKALNFISHQMQIKTTMQSVSLFTHHNG